jgi:hypothetical protein
VGRPVVTTVSSATADADGYATSQSLGAAGPLTLDGALVSGGVGTPEHPCRVTVTSAGDDSGIDFIVTGTGPDPGNPSGTVAISETIAGANIGVATTLHDFSTVTDISGSDATAGDVTAGTSETASGPWVPWDVNVRTKFEVSAAGVVTEGSPTWQVDVTFDDIFANPNSPAVTVWTELSGKTGDTFGYINQPVRASRLTLVAAGTVRLTQTQQGD